MSSIRFENFVATGLDSHSVNNKVRIFVVVTQLLNYQNIDSERNNCCLFLSKTPRYVPLNMFMPNFVAFFVFCGTALKPASIGHYGELK